MVHRVKEEDIQKLSRFIKINNSYRSSHKIKDITQYLSDGLKSEIISEDSFITKKGNTIDAFAHAIVFRSGKSQINDITISEKTSEKDLFDLINGCLEHLKQKGSKEIELISPAQLERFFKKMSFEKVGEKQNEIFMRNIIKSEKQSSLRAKFDDEEMLKKISEKTSEQLRKLR